MTADRQPQQSVARFDGWRRLAGIALREVATPCFVFSAQPIAEALAGLDGLGAAVADGTGGRVGVVHWLSCKTQPLPALLRWWRRQGRPIEVVSEFEFLAARASGYPIRNILCNGPAKHRWLLRHAARGQRVHFDSETELEALIPVAKRLRWRVGLRLRTAGECDPAATTLPTQFGFEPAQAIAALQRLRRSGLAVDSIHFHLRTNVTSADAYRQGLVEVADVCAAADFQPRFVDIGGGFPPPYTRSHEGTAYDRRFKLEDMARVLVAATSRFPRIEAFWLENGRHVLARSGVLVLTVLDIKHRGTLRYAICDGGRTMNALVSTWERHDLIELQPAQGPRVDTMVCGPTCMAFDQLGTFPLSASLRPGDRLLWLDAGAYHIPWETRFSHGLPAVVWHEGQRQRVVRAAETFDRYWGMWHG